jgi:long-chain fatty acid transport protein
MSLSMCIVVPTAVSAAGFQITEQNASGLGYVYAGQAALADDASAVYFNPAQMARLKDRRQVVVGAQFIGPSSKFSDDGSCSPFLGGAAGTTACPVGTGGNLGHVPGGDGGASSKVRPIPDLYGAWEVLPQSIWVGIGVNAPFGLAIERDPSWIGRFHSINSRTATININPSIAWRANDSISIGGGLDVQRMSATLTNAVSYRALALASGVPALAAAVPAGSEGVASIKGHDWGWGYNLGADVRLSQDFNVALAYRSSVGHRLVGNVQFDQRPLGLGTVPQIADGAVHASIRLPSTSSLAAAWQASPSIRLAADWTHTKWEVVQDLTIVRDDGPLAAQTLTTTPLNFRNSWRAGIGIEWKVDSAWTFRTGYAYETSPVVDAYRTPRLPDSNRNWYGLGGRWTFAADRSIDVGAALIRAKRAPVGLANQDSALSLPQGSLVGAYSSRAINVGTQLNWAFE